MIVENVRGAQKWVGKSAWNYGSFHLWGDVPALMSIAKAVKITGQDWSKFAKMGEVSPHWRMEGLKCGDASERRWEDRTVKRLRDATKDQVRKQLQDSAGTKQGGDWFGAGCDMSISRMYSSKSIQRKRAAAEIAKIPFPLSQFIALTYYPQEVERAR